jgi:EmrB/QacA subfamily drug resistance transporter
VTGAPVAGTDTRSPRDAGTAAATAATAVTGRRIHIVMLAMMSGLFLAALDANIVSVAMPTIAGDLGGVDQITWIITAYLLTQTIATPIAGKLSDLYGRKPTFQVTIVAFLAGSALCGAAPNMPALIAFRALQGIGAGGLLALPMAIVGDIVPPAQRGRYQGYISATFAISALLGPLVGGFIVDHLSWRWVFYVNLPVAVVSMALVQRYLVLPHRPSRRRIDYVGAALLAAGVSPLLLALHWGGDGTHAWLSPTIIGLLGWVVAVLVAFVLWELRASEPILPMRLFRSSVVSVTCVGAFISGAGVYGGALFIPTFLQVVRDLSATRSGMSVAPMMVAVLTASITSGRLIARTGRYKIFPISGVFLLTIGCILFATIDVHTTYAGIAARLVVLGFGMGQIGPSLMIIIQNAVEHRDLGVATGAINFIRTLGGAVATAVLGAVFAARLDVLIPRYVGEEGMATVPESTLRGQPKEIAAIADPVVHDGVVRAFADAVRATYFVAIPACVVALVIFTFVREVPLRQSLHDDGEALSPHPIEVGT